MFDEFFTKATELRSLGVPFATAIVVRAEAPSSAKPGDKAIVTLDGVMHGWIGGSCAQPTVVEEAVRAIADGRCRLLRLTPQPGEESLPAGIEERLMTCYSGGTLEVYIEPQQPQPTLLVVGHLPVAQALAHLGRAMSYRVLAVDPSGGAAMSHADEVLSDFSAIGHNAGPLTYVVIASHGNFDDSALEAALRAPVAYVGLVASRKRAESVRAQLAAAGVEEAALARLRAPAGLDIGAGRGDEIALSIMAEIVQHRRSQDRLEWPAAEASAKDETQTLVDPVCGMEVPVPRYRFEYAGTTYSFCCEGCRTRFAAQPERYAATAGEARR